MNNRKPKFNLEIFDYRRLREIRKAKGYSSSELCRKVFYAYNSVEDGTKLPSLKSLSDIIHFLDLNIFEIAIILKAPGITPNDYIAVRTAAKLLKRNLNDITKEFIREIRRYASSPDQEIPAS